MPYKDPERQREYAREWLKKNAQKARDAVRRWRLAHPERHNAKNRLYNARHKGERNAYMAVYNREHPEVVLAKWHNYRARKRAAAGSFTSAEWLALVASYEGRCAYCGEAKPLGAPNAAVARGIECYRQHRAGLPPLQRAQTSDD